eukprot:6199182-Pleurochrysis_carterae.AAC.2
MHACEGRQPEAEGRAEGAVTDSCIDVLCALPADEGMRFSCSHSPRRQRATQIRLRLAENPGSATTRALELNHSSRLA